MQGREEEGEAHLRRALELDSQVAEIHHSLGLLLVRRQQREEALASLEKAVELAPDQARFAYVYGVALHDLGQMAASLDVLEQAHDRSPANREILVALVSFHREAGDSASAAAYGQKLLKLDPTNPDLRQFVEQLSGATG